MKKILVVDDEERIRKIYTSLLRSEGFDTVAVCGAVKANERLKNGHFDLILLDLKMPKVGGNVVYEIVQMFHKNAQVIVTSVYPIEDQKDIIKGAVDYYDKSQGINVLLDKVKKALTGYKNERKEREGENRSKV